MFEGDIYDASIQDLYIGTSKAAQQPKVTIKWVVTSEYSGIEIMTKKEKEKHITTIGENVLETASLQPQAIWKLSGLWKEVTGEPKIPMGDYEVEELETILKEQLVGYACKIQVEPDLTQTPPRMSVVARIPKG